MRKLFFIASVVPLIWGGSASAMPAVPLTSQSDLIEVRTVCNQWGQCCATGSGQCFYRAQPRTYYRQQQRDYNESSGYNAPPEYGYDRQPYVQQRPYYGGRRDDYDD
jgi:hypothetical protein